VTLGIQVGTILIRDSRVIDQRLELESDSYLPNWSVVRALNAFALDRKIHAAGWNSFFMADEVRASAFGSIQADNLRTALQRIFQQVRGQDFNCLEVTGISARHFLGIPYFTVSAHSRHIQHGWRLDPPQERRTVHDAATA
jgi:hypothetical protein